MSLAVRRLLLLVVATAIGFAGLPVHADKLPAAHHELAVQAIDQDEHLFGVAHHADTAGAECIKVGHCSSIQLHFGNHVDAPEVLRRDTWCAPDDHHATSSKLEASTPPPRPA